MNQKNLESRAMGLVPTQVIAPPVHMLTLRKLANDTVKVGGTNGESNAFQGAFEPIISARLESGVTIETETGDTVQAAAKPAAWIASVGPNNPSCGTFVVGFLPGMNSPILERERSLGTLGEKYQVKLAFGVGVEDWRGVYQNDGD